MPGLLHLSIKRGLPLLRKFKLSVHGGAVINLTGAQTWAKIMPQDYSAPAVELNPENGKLVISDAEQGEITLSIAGEETATYAWEAARWVFHVSHRNGEDRDYLGGMVLVNDQGGGE
jgi:hypothetical protein